MKAKPIKKKFNIPWKLKSLIFGCIDYLHASRILYFFQKYITKRSQITSLVLSQDWVKHKDSLKKYNTINKLFEFGAGKTLVQNLYLSDVVKTQFVVDLYPMIDLDLVEIVRQKLIEIVRLKSKVVIKNIKDLEYYGIYYKAPYDSTKTNFPDNSIDACISTNTLEHISKSDIIAILSELHRILKDEGIISAIIDYSDHYAHTDNNISLLNFLKFTPHKWRKYNHNIHYQNRLRHYEFIDMFKNAGFNVIKEELIYAEKNIPSDILNSYKNFNPNWKATSAHIILKKAK